MGLVDFGRYFQSIRILTIRLYRTDRNSRIITTTGIIIITMVECRRMAGITGTMADLMVAIIMAVAVSMAAAIATEAVDLTAAVAVGTATDQFLVILDASLGKVDVFLNPA